jgi:hypothetical protein
MGHVIGESFVYFIEKSLERPYASARPAFVGWLSGGGARTEGQMARPGGRGIVAVEGGGGGARRMGGRHDATVVVPS